MLPLDLYRSVFRQANGWQSEQSLPNSISNWLFYTDSLTQKLQQYCVELSVEITQQGWQVDPLADEWQKETIASAVWLREVVLKGDQQAWIFAQTLIPKQTIEQVAQAVLELGETPIGLWLFPQQPTRVSLMWTQDTKTGLYARRSIFELQGYPLQIDELFLAQFPFESTPRKA